MDCAACGGASRSLLGCRLEVHSGFHAPYPSSANSDQHDRELGVARPFTENLPVGTAYAIWTGIGTLGTAILGLVLLGEAATFARLVCIGLIVAGIVGLKIVSPE